MVLVVVAPKGAPSAASDEGGAMGVDMNGSRYVVSGADDGRVVDAAR